MKMIITTILSILLISSYMPVYADDAGTEKMEDKLTVNTAALEEADFDGYIYAVSEDATKSQLNRMEKKVNKTDAVEEIWDDELFRADSIEDIEAVADADIIEYIEPDYKLYLFDDVRNDDASIDTVQTDDAGTNGVPVDSVQAAATRTADAQTNDVQATAQTNGVQTDASQSDTAQADAVTCNDTYYSTNEWMYSLVNAQEVWSDGLYGAGQCKNDTPVVAVLDSGLAGASTTAYRHEDINYNNMIDSYYYSGAGSADDENGHGTFVAGEIAAIMNNSKGVAGFMPEVTIIPARLMDENGQGSISNAITLMNTLVSRGDVDVINMSFGSESSSTSLNTACTAAAEKGILLIASAGNDGNTKSGSKYNYPASCDYVISVGSVSSSGTYSYYSQHNDKVDVAAPGQNIAGLGSYTNNTYNQSDTDGYSSMSGTSMSAPVVSALAAMAKSVYPDITHDVFMSILKTTSTDAGTTGYDNYYGYGIVNFEAVLEALPSAHKDLTATAAVAATCTESGNYAYWTCRDCGKFFSDEKGITEIEENSWVTAAKGHTWDAGTVTKEATCTEKGVKTYTCTVCGEENTEEIAINADAHDWGDWITTKEATEDEDGLKVRTCKNNTSHTQEEIILKLNHIHSLEKTEAKDATCTEAGNSAYWTCSSCGKYFSDENAENEIEKDSWVIKAAGHTLIKTEAKDATCTGVGNSAYWTCSECSKYFSDEKGEKPIEKDSWIIAALGHSYGNWTYLDEDQHQKVCANDSSHIEKADHTWNEGEVTTEATATTAGVRTYTCTACGGTKTESIPATGGSSSGGGTGGGGSGGSSGGGSSDGGGGSTETTEETPAVVPITDTDSSVSVTATISDNTAVVGEITAEDLANASDGETVSLDMTKVVSDQTITTVALTKSTIANIAASAASALEIKLQSGSITLDTDALKTITASAGSDIQVSIETGSASMNNVQLEAISGMGNPVTVDASITADGKTISDLSVTLSIPYTSDNLVRAWYIADDGTKEAVPCSYDNGAANLTLSHLSHYVVEEYTMQDNTLTVKAKTAKVKYSKLKKAKQIIMARKLLKISDAVGTVTYKKVSGNKNFTINSKTGNVTVKKGTKKGTYRIKIKVTAAGEWDYLIGSKTVTAVIKVK